MQYFKPADPKLFAGDCMPFFHNGVFHLFYLQDENHHQGLGGLGGHQWAHASSTDLVHWQYHPLAIPITAEWECSICTGSLFYHAGVYYGFYATRLRDGSEHLSLAISRDSIHFQKTEPNPFFSPPRGYRRDFRDPFVFHDEAMGLFHMLVTAHLENYALPDRGGCLAHLTSTDLRHWEVRDPFLIPGLSGAPECSDYFQWNDWYYLIFSNGGMARYRMSRHPFGPWARPPVDTFDGGAARVMKTAAFGSRRLGTAFLGTREGNRDHGHLQYAGNVIFREIIQQDDGTLWTKFPQEMVPTTTEPLPLPFTALTPGITGEMGYIRIKAHEGLGAALFTNVPQNARITAKVIPHVAEGIFGIHLRAAETFDSGYCLSFSPSEGQVQLFHQAITAVNGLDRPFSVEIVSQGDILDVCIAGSRTIVNRCPEQHGDRLLLYGQDTDVTFNKLEIRPFNSP